MNIDETLAYIHTTDWRGTKDWYVRMAAQYLDPDNYHPVK